MNPTIPYCNHLNVLHIAFTFFLHYNYLAETLIQSSLEKHAVGTVMKTFIDGVYSVYKLDSVQVDLRTKIHFKA